MTEPGPVECACGLVDTPAFWFLGTLEPQDAENSGALPRARGNRRNDKERTFRVFCARARRASVFCVRQR